MRWLKQLTSGIHSIDISIGIDTPALPVNHCSQSTVCGALNRKVRGTRRGGITAWQTEQQHNVNCARHTVTDGSNNTR